MFERMHTPVASTGNTSAVITRLLFLGGLVVTALLLYLGGIWPSIYTLIAIPALSSPILFLVAVFHPTLIRNHRILRYYLVVCSIVAALTWVFEFWWLSRPR